MVEKVSLDFLLLLLLPSAVVFDGHKVVLEVREVGAEVVAGGLHAQILARGVDVAIGGRGHDEAQTRGQWGSPRATGGWRTATR